MPWPPSRYYSPAGCCETGELEEARDSLIELTDIAKRIRMGHRGAV